MNDLPSITPFFLNSARCSSAHFSLFLFQFGSDFRQLAGTGCTRNDPEVTNLLHDDGESCAEDCTDGDSGSGLSVWSVRVGDVREGEWCKGGGTVAKSGSSFSDVGDSAGGRMGTTGSSLIRDEGVGNRARGEDESRRGLFSSCKLNLCLLALMSSNVAFRLAALSASVSVPGGDMAWKAGVVSGVTGGEGNLGDAFQAVALGNAIGGSVDDVNLGLAV